MNRIFVTGDTHGGSLGGLFKLLSFRKRNELDNTDVMIIAGDWGFIWAQNPKNQDEIKAKTRLNNHGITYFVVLGNHENYDRIEKLPTKEMYGGVVRYEPVFPNIVYATNGYYQINGKNFWTMNGGFSIDKAVREPHKSWWPQEVPTLEELDKYWEAFNNGPKSDVDFVVTHTCPLNLSPFDKFSQAFNPDDVDKNLDIFLQHVWIALKHANQKYKWYCGHFHLDMQAQVIRFLYNDIIELT